MLRNIISINIHILIKINNSKNLEKINNNNTIPYMFGFNPLKSRSTHEYE